MAKVTAKTKLAQVLEEQGRTAVFLAKKLHKTRARISQFTTGKDIPTKKDQQTISDILGVSVSELFPQSDLNPAGHSTEK